MPEKINKNGIHNRKVFTQTLNENGFDAEYLLTWGLPSFWTEEFWNYSEYVMTLLGYFERKYKVYDSRDSFEEFD